jgi:hypothetical protein
VQTARAGNRRVAIEKILEGETGVAQAQPVSAILAMPSAERNSALSGDQRRACRQSRTPFRFFASIPRAYGSLRAAQAPVRGIT